MKQGYCVFYSLMRGFDRNKLLAFSRDEYYSKLKSNGRLRDVETIGQLKNPDLMENLINILDDNEIVYGEIYDPHSGVYLSVYFYINTEVRSEVVDFMKKYKLI